MAFVAPFFCSIVSAMFALFPERSLRKTIVAIHFSVTGALWLLLLIYTYSATASWASVVSIRASIAAFAYGIPLVVLLVRFVKWKRSDNPQLNDKGLGITQLQWIVICIAVEGILLVQGIAFGMVEDGKVWNCVNATAIMIQQILVTDYIIRRIYHRVNGANDSKSKNGTPSGISALIEQHTEHKLSHKTLENYFNLKHPYTDPEFSLVDLAAAMGVNRSEISAFINRTYGINFKRYVNRWRLREYQKLMTLPSNERKTPHRILPLAGFTDSRHYQRALAAENRPEAESEENTMREEITEQKEAAAHDKTAEQTPREP